MINVNDKLIREELPHIGSDAFTVLLVIASHLGVHQTAWPGMKRIREMAAVEVGGEMRDMSQKRVYAGLKRLENRNLISRKQVKGKGGVFSHTVYTLSDKYLSVYIKSDNKLTEQENDRIVESDHTDINRMVESRNTENRNTENRNTELLPLSINKEEVLINNEVLIKEKHTSESDFQQPEIDLEDPRLPWQVATDFFLNKLKSDRLTAKQIELARDITGWEGSLTDLKKIIQAVFRDCENNSQKYGYLIYSLPGNQNAYFSWLSKIMARIQTFMEYRVRNQNQKETNNSPAQTYVPMGFKRQTV